MEAGEDDEDDEGGLLSLVVHHYCAGCGAAVLGCVASGFALCLEQLHGCF